MAFAVFSVVKAMNALRACREAEPVAPSEEVALLGEIRDLLKSRP